MITKLQSKANYIILTSPVGGIFPIPPALAFSNFVDAWKQASLGSALETSTIVAVGVVAATTILSVLAGFAFGTLDLPGGRIVFYMFLAGLVMPYESMIIPLYYDMRSFNLIDSYWSLILPETALYLAFGIFWMRACFRSVPRSLLEAARIDGASNWRVLWRIFVPFGKPAIFTMMVLYFVFSWNEFLLPLVMLSSGSRQTATLALGQFQGQYDINVSLQTAAALSVAVPVIVVYVLFQRQFIRGMLSGSVKE
jgi:raffinose/stachyose/melibiose transport system permease protein